MKIYAQWFGGGSYGWGDDLDIESFNNLAEAKREFGFRHSNPHVRHVFHFTNKLQEQFYCPVVDESSEMWVFFGNPTGSGDKYPDRIIKIGPRGGIVVERT